MPSFSSFKIGTKILCIVLLLSAVAAIISWRGLEVKGLIYAVVMDTRGVFMGRSHEESEKFAKPLLENLGHIQDFMKKWHGLLPDARKSELDSAQKGVDEFVTYRNETVRLSREVSLEKARV